MLTIPNPEAMLERIYPKPPNQAFRGIDKHTLTIPQLIAIYIRTNNHEDADRILSRTLTTTTPTPLSSLEAVSFSGGTKAPFYRSLRYHTLKEPKATMSAYRLRHEPDQYLALRTDNQIYTEPDLFFDNRLGVHDRNTLQTHYDLKIEALITNQLPLYLYLEYVRSFDQIVIETNPREVRTIFKNRNLVRKLRGVRWIP